MDERSERTTDIMDTADRVIAATYQRFPIALVSGSGCELTDADGRRYIDFLAGIAVCNLGHCHPAVTEAVARQAQTLVHVSNLYYTEPQTELASWLTDRCFADRVFFCNSGAEANEAAIKLARRYFHERGETGRHRIICMAKSFHGRTMATLSATGQDKIKKGFDPILQGFDFVPFDDIEALKAKMDGTVAAVMLEPAQGEGGVRVPSDGYLSQVRDLCDDTGALMILDEVQTGIGRAGRLFAHQRFGIEPDIMTLAKALANGLPMGAMLATEKAARAFGPGAHATTFGGGPLIAAAALATLRTLEAEDLAAEAERKGEYFRERLLTLSDRCPAILGVRGMGLLVGLELDDKGGPVVAACMAKGFLINCIQENILRFAPPLIITEAQIDALIDCLDGIFSSKEWKR